MSSLNLNIAIYASFNIIFGLYSHFIKERLFLSESLVSLLFGILLGPLCLKAIYPTQRDIEMDEFWFVIHQLARFVMTFQTMAAGVSLPRAYLKRKWKMLSILLGPVMLSMWITSTLIIYTIFYSSFSLLESMALAACITPTDPVLASSIAKGRFAEEHIPEHVRDLLSAERYA
jgi:NhaP-type Na+/H+ or K+/H+ antiporter